MVSAKEQGNKGEQIAMQYLKRLGFEIVEMNYRFGHGEIDIVAREGETLVFCEVKMRKNEMYGDPEFAITPKKQQQIRKVALGYLYEHEIKEQECRFDVVAIRLYRSTPEINYIRNAF
jgi:putative endonuclease